MPPPSLSLRAPAKINLALHVTGRRADGYHLLETLVVFCELCDRLEIGPSQRDEFAIVGRFADGLGMDERNLVIRARDRLRTAFGARQCPPVSIRLDKNLPVASGMGGGSSDAAAALRGLARLWKLDPDEAALAALGKELGADVPMCLAAIPLVASGVGEDIEPLAAWPAMDAVLVNPGVAVSTPEVFSRLASRENPPLPLPPDRPDYDGIRAWLGTTRNDLEAPARAIAPAIAHTLDALHEAGAGFARMTGSGATCFGLFPDGHTAASAAAAVREANPAWFVERTRMMGTTR